MVNKISLIGNLGADPEVRQLENGTSVGRFSLATSDSYKDKDGNWQKQTEWHNVVIWRELAERAQTNLKKGMTVYVEGKVTYRKYTDKDGVERNVCDVVANTVRSLEKREASEPSANYQDAIPAAQPRQEAVPVANGTPTVGPNPTHEDLPW